MGRYQLRWWDGEHWTDQVHTSGLPGVDPLGTRPSDDPDHVVLLPSTPTSETDVDYRPRAGSGAITASLLMIIGGIIGYLITSGIAGGGATAQALALWGTLGGIFGILTIAGGHHPRRRPDPQDGFGIARCRRQATDALHGVRTGPGATSRSTTTFASRGHRSFWSSEFQGGDLRPLAVPESGQRFKGDCRQSQGSQEGDQVACRLRGGLLMAGMIACALTLAACGGDGESPSQPVATESAAEAPDTTDEATADEPDVPDMSAASLSADAGGPEAISSVCIDVDNDDWRSVFEEVFAFMGVSAVDDGCDLQVRLTDTTVERMAYDYYDETSGSTLSCYNTICIEGMLSTTVGDQQREWDVNACTPYTDITSCRSADDPIEAPFPFKAADFSNALGPMFGDLGWAACECTSSGYYEGSADLVRYQDVLASLLMHGTEEQRCAASECISDSAYYGRRDDALPLVPALLHAWKEFGPECVDYSVETIADREISNYEEAVAWWESREEISGR